MAPLDLAQDNVTPFGLRCAVPFGGLKLVASGGIQLGVAEETPMVNDPEPAPNVA